jgi:hypothetical protein
LAAGFAAGFGAGFGAGLVWAMAENPRAVASNTKLNFFINVDMIMDILIEK